MKWGPDHTERQKKDDGCTKAGRCGGVKMTDGYLTAPVLVGEEKTSAFGERRLCDVVILERGEVIILAKCGRTVKCSFEICSHGF